MDRVTSIAERKLALYMQLRDKLAEFKRCLGEEEEEHRRTVAKSRGGAHAGGGGVAVA